MPRGIPKTRAILTPGETATAASDAPANDLVEFDDPNIPEAAVPSAQELIAQNVAMQTRIAKLEAALANVAKAQQEKPAGKHDAPVTMEEAIKAAQEAVSKGQRPRAILTHEGWYIHPEAARTPGSLGNSAQFQVH